MSISRAKGLILLHTWCQLQSELSVLSLPILDWYHSVN